MVLKSSVIIAMIDLFIFQIVTLYKLEHNLVEAVE